MLASVALIFDWRWIKNNPSFIEMLCPTQMAYWAKNYVTILTRALNEILLRAAHWMAYFDVSKLNLA